MKPEFIIPKILISPRFNRLQFLLMSLLVSVAISGMTSCGAYSKSARDNRAYRRYVEDSIEKKNERQQEYIKARQEDTSRTITEGSEPGPANVQIIQ